MAHKWTPKYYVDVYSGRAHWDKPIDELCEMFEHKWQAEQYAKQMQHFCPNYYVEIVEQ